MEMPARISDQVFGADADAETEEPGRSENGRGVDADKDQTVSDGAEDGGVRGKAPDEARDGLTPVSEDPPDHQQDPSDGESDHQDRKDI